MASATTEQRVVSRAVVDGVEDEHGQAQQHADNLVGDCDCGRAAAVASRRVSRLDVEGGRGDADAKAAARAQQDGIGGDVVGNGGHRLHELHHAGAPRFRRSFGGERALPPPHAWLAIDDTRKNKQQEHVHGESDPEAEQWARLFRGGGAGAAAAQEQRRRSSFSVVRRERAAREAWLDRAWEMKRSWHERNGGAPDADTPVVVVVGTSPRASQQQGQRQAVAAFGGGGGVAMDVEEVRACRDLGLELPSDCTVEIQCYGLSDGGSPTHTASSGADSPFAVSTPTAAAGGGADPTDVKARLKVWAQAVALASTTHLAS